MLIKIEYMFNMLQILKVKLNRYLMDHVEIMSIEFNRLCMLWENKNIINEVMVDNLQNKFLYMIYKWFLSWT